MASHRDLNEQGMGAAAFKIFSTELSPHVTVSSEIPHASLIGISNGSRASADDLVADYGTLVWGLANKFPPCTATAEEVTVEIFACLFQEAANFDPNRGTEAAFVRAASARCILRRAFAERNRIQHLKRLEINRDRTE